jgi:hypothetical protein
MHPEEQNAVHDPPGSTNLALDLSESDFEKFQSTPIVGLEAASASLYPRYAP